MAGGCITLTLASHMCITRSAIVRYQTHENRRFSVNHHTRVPQIQATSSLIVRLAPVMLKSMPSPARYRAAVVQTQFDWILILS